MVKNNKGFMLIEVIIVSTIVGTTMTLLFTSFNRLYNNYRIKNSYYNIDAVYATKEMLNSMIEDNFLNKFINNKIAINSYEYVINNSLCTPNYSPSSCQNLKDLYDINNMIFSKYDISSLNALKETNLNQTLKDYIDYLITYYDLENTTNEYNYIILTEINDKNNYYYANIRTR